MVDVGDDADDGGVELSEKDLCTEGGRPRPVAPAHRLVHEHRSRCAGVVARREIASLQDAHAHRRHVTRR